MASVCATRTTMNDEVTKRQKLEPHDEHKNFAYLCDTLEQLANQSHESALLSLTSADLARKTSQSIAQSKYREKKKHRVACLEREVERLVNRVQELERSGADAVVIVNNPESALVEKTTRRMTELELNVQEKVLGLREAYWTETCEQLKLRVMDLMPPVKRLKLAAMRGHGASVKVGTNMDIMFNPPIEHWVKVVQKVKMPLEKMRLVASWFQMFLGRLGEFQERRTAALNALLVAHNSLDSSKWIGANVMSASHLPVDSYHLKHQKDVDLNAALLNDCVAEQEKFIDTTTMDFCGNVLGWRLAVELILVSLPQVMDPVGLCRAIVLLVAEVEKEKLEKACSAPSDHDDFDSENENAGEFQEDLEDENENEREFQE